MGKWTLLSPSCGCPILVVLATLLHRPGSSVHSWAFHAWNFGAPSAIGLSTSCVGNACYIKSLAVTISGLDWVCLLLWSLLCLLHWLWVLFSSLGLECLSSLCTWTVELTHWLCCNAAGVGFHDVGPFCLRRWTAPSASGAFPSTGYECCLPFGIWDCVGVSCNEQSVSMQINISWLPGLLALPHLNDAYGGLLRSWEGRGRQAAP